MRIDYNSTVSDMTGGRVAILFLLFALAIYEFIVSGFSLFAIICIIPIPVLAAILLFRNGMSFFWILMLINYFIQWKNFPPIGVPTSLPNEMLQLLLIAMAVINIREFKFERCANIMTAALLVWLSYCTLEVLNDTCGLGIQVGAWYTGARLMAFQLMYIAIVFTLYIKNPTILIRYLYVWAFLAMFAAFWVWKQQHLGFTQLENAFIQGRGRTTHVINGGATIRYFSIFSDAANFGVSMAATAAVFLVMSINCKIKKYRRFFIITGLVCVWGMMPSGTRTAMFCLLGGIGTYVILSKSIKIAIPVGLAFVGIFVFLAFTDIGNGNAQIRRMRSGFNTDDPSANVRAYNQSVMKKYLADAPFGIGIGIGYENVPANNKFRKLATLPPDSEYVFIWQHTGTIGIICFLLTTAVIFLTASYIVMFRLRNKTLMGIGAGFVCGFVAIQLGGYANQVLMQFPNCMLFYGSMSLVFVLPYIEPEWEVFEQQKLAEQAEKERLKEEKKRAKRV